ncbi:hypothetical protein BJF82_06845 [Kytococcus sp. CUA-901]|nr:hypothetical protein BJF82_06845 [Kytococcus sp. CUA-901]
MARLALRRPTGEWAPMVAASSRARSRAEPAATSSSTMPSSAASGAGYFAAVKIARAARLHPMRRVRSCVPPPPGMTPTDTSGSPSSAPSPATMRSHESAISSPPPRAKPSTAAMVGIGRSSTPE